MKRRAFFALIAGAAISLPSHVLAQKRIFRIGWLVFGDASLGPVDRALKEALAQEGLVDGGAIQILQRFANGNSNRVAELANELAALKPDLLLAIGSDVVNTLFDASKGNIPVVGGVSENPVRAGMAISLAKPGKNFTGVTFLTDEMAAKRMEILKEVAPGTKRVAVIFNSQHLDDEVTFARRGAESLDVELTTHPIKSPGEIDAVLRAVAAKQANGIFVIPSRLTRFVGEKIARYGIEQRIPVIAAWREFAATGALLSYGPNVVLEAKRVAGYVQKVLNGAKPAELPIEQPVKFELVINLKTARSIGLTIGRDFMLRADDLID